MALAYVLESLGALMEARANLEQARAMMEGTPLWIWMGPSLLSLRAHLAVQVGDLAEADAAVEATRQALSPNMRAASLGSSVLGQWWQPEIELYLARGEFAAALAASDDILPRLRRSHVRRYLPAALRLKADALIGLGEAGAAHGALLEAANLAQAMGLRHALWRVLARQADLEAATGQPGTAAALRRHAADIVRHIADHAGRPELRASFLSLPAVQAVLHSTA
jgi:hypothetical protein